MPKIFVKMNSLNKKVKVLNRQIFSHPLATTYLWFYRLIGITFGGLSIDSNGKFHINRCLKIFGYCYEIFYAVLFIICFNYMLSTTQFQSLYENNDETAYFVVIFYYCSQLVQIIVNLFYLNRKGMVFVKVMVEFQEIEIKKNQKILFTFWIIHILVPVLSLVYSFTATDLTYFYETNIFLLSLYCIFRLLSFYYFWVTSIIIWIISIHFYDFLVDIKKQLQQEVYNKQGDLIFQIIIQILTLFAF